MESHVVPRVALYLIKLLYYYNALEGLTRYGSSSRNPPYANAGGAEMGVDPPGLEDPWREEKLAATQY